MPNSRQSKNIKMELANDNIALAHQFRLDGGWQSFLRAPNPTEISKTGQLKNLIEKLLK